MGTVNTNFLPNSTGLDLGSSSQKWDAFLRDLTTDTSLITSFLAKSMGGVRFVDAANLIGWTGSTLDAWIAAAFAAIGGPGKVVVLPGTYSATNTIFIANGQELRFEGCPTINFSLSGTTVGFDIGGNFSQYALDGQACINMQNTGGTVFKIHGGFGFTVGPSSGFITVSNPTGNIMDVGPASNTESMDSFTIRNIESGVGTTIPGDFVQLITNNYGGAQNAAPFIISGRFVNLRVPLAGGGGIAGYAVRINANAVGPELNVNGIAFENCLFCATAGNAKNPIHIQSTLLTGTGNSINFSVLGGYTSRPSALAIAMIDVDSVITANAIWGITLNGHGSFWSPTSNFFSATLLNNVLASGSLNAFGFNGPYQNMAVFGGTGADLLTPVAGEVTYRSDLARLRYYDSAWHSLIGNDTTDTLTNKTLTAPVINGTPTGTGIPTLTLKKGTGAGSYTAANTAYADIDSTNLKYTVTVPTGWKLLIHANYALGTSTAVVQAFVAIADGGVILTETNSFGNAAGNTQAASLGTVITGDGVSHVITLQARTTNAADAWLVLNSTATLAPTMTFNLTPSN